MLGLGGENLNPKLSGLQSDHATANMVFSVHLLILEDLDHHQT